jgi:hypothetical protein
VNADMALHIAEILFIGVPIWWGAIRFFVVLKEYPPHVHENGGIIRYPKGMEPGKIQRIGETK